MKKVFFSIILVVILILVFITVAISQKNAESNSLKSFNSEYEQYLGQTLYGTDILTIINKAIDNNEKYAIEKDNEGYYLENEENVVKVELTLLSLDEEGNTKEVTHQMERLNQIGLDKFIMSFNLTEFKCTNIEYTDSGRVHTIYLKQQEL